MTVMIIICHFLFFQNVHPASVRRYEELSFSSKAKAKKRSHGDAEIASNAGANGTSKKLQQETMTYYQNANMVSQKRVDQLIVGFIISGMLSLHTIELPAFRNLITGLQPNRTVMSRPTLRKLILDDATEMKLKLITVLAEQKFMATTTDC